MRGNIVFVTDSVLNSRAHRRERKDVMDVTSLIRDGFIVGGGAVLIQMGSAKRFNHGELGFTKDVDIVTSNSESQEIGQRHGTGLEYLDLIAEAHTRFEHREGPIESEVMELFGHYRIANPFGPMSDLAQRLDIFTPQTGLGPIPITPYVLSHGFDVVAIDGSEQKVGKPFLLIASQLNPVARTELRTKRMMYLMLQAYQRDPAAFEGDVVGMAMRYIGYGDESAESVLINHPEIDPRTRPILLHYEEGVRKVANVVGIGMKNKFIQAAGKFGLSKEDAVTVVQMVSDNFRDYQTTRIAQEERVEAFSVTRD